MDLSIGDRIAISIADERHLIDPFNQESIDSTFEFYNLPAILPPGRFALLATKDVVTIPRDLAGFVQIRSTFARLGLNTPATVAGPGFQGHLVLEVTNNSGCMFKIDPNIPIWSLQMVPSCSETYSGRYQGQEGITLPKALK